MYTIIITALIFIIIGAYKGYKKNGFKYNYLYDWEDYLNYASLNLVLSFLVSLPIAFLLPNKTYIETKYYDLESVQLNKYINGNFFILSGNINNDYNYAVYVNQNETFKLKFLPYENTYISYTDERPLLEVTTEKETDNFINKFAISHKYFTRYDLKVPKGSIVKEYKLQ